jgi:nucleotide-binding universal stress UspA family protein
MNAHHGAMVVGIDAGSDSPLGLDWAATAAAGRGLPLHLVHALGIGYSELPPTPREERERHERAQRLLTDATARAGALGADKVTTEIVDRPPAPALLDAAGTAATVVLGARGHGALFGMLIGSVSRHVSQHAPCTVVVVREPANPGQRRIVVGVDGSAGSDVALGYAFDSAARDGRPLVAVHGWRDHSTGAAGIESAAWSRTAERIERGERLLDEALREWTAKYPQVHVSREAIPVHPARLLADASENAALVVVGARGHGGFVGLLLGSVSQSVLHMPAARSRWRGRPGDDDDPRRVPRLLGH